MENLLIKDKLKKFTRGGNTAFCRTAEVLLVYSMGELFR